MSQIKVLIIDDEADVCTFFRRLLTRKGYDVVTASKEPEAMRAIEEHRFTVAMVDLKLPDTDGLTLLQAIKARQPACEVIIMTGYSTIKTAVAAMQLGAYEYLEKPFDDIDEIEALIEKAASHGFNLQQGSAAAEEWAEVARAVGFQVGASLGMRRLVSVAHKIAGKNVTVLIQGSTGTGKEVLARFIHSASGRADQAFIPVNCGALPENLQESELFGHEKGAFTGAAQPRRGIFELANRGTLFLDEIGDASPQIQVKLLRVLETGEFMRVGGEKPIKTDVRVIAATNVDLEQAIREKTFREDLYYRLNVVRLEIPPLRSRSEDIPQLAEHFVRQLNAALRISPPALRLLQGYGWPGNIRQLANVIRRAVVMCSGDTILPEHLESTLLNSAALAGDTFSPVSSQAGEGAVSLSPERLWRTDVSVEELRKLGADELKRMLDSLRALEGRLITAMGEGGGAARRCLNDTEEETIRQALEQYRWNITETAKVLGIGRNTLYRKIKQYGLGSS
ncbi:two component, sigma54 specific, transcriptional regulator, Fis family [Geobacter metallireducens RCH3]|uniref:sigma-54-dependent transcriptional regulator n=1 Tax=Geobacter metallireducens TaxID=28232 RepID=UPI00024A51BF|nr:sigma-54 dependent transcriptional regulator [Geobacter metallireducens]EHP86543.1 two component, sigma54 specific, transcriptional regulator, Fis family [Geobacter metallireducens RCH3]